MGKEEALERMTEKAQAVISALRAGAKTMDADAEQTLNRLAENNTTRAKALFQLGLRVHDPTVSQKSFRRMLADLGLAKARERPWQGRRQEAKKAWRKECKAALQPRLSSLFRQAPAGASEPTAAARRASDASAGASEPAATATQMLLH